MTLALAATDAYGNAQAHDGWGGVPSWAAIGGPKGWTCANLDHGQDDESGLIYMRAWYPEQGRKKYINEDFFHPVEWGDS
jgi:hypothetical protein